MHPHFSKNDLAAAIAACISGAALRRFIDARHLPTTEKPEPVNATRAAWLVG
jgi:pimeloyl-ACP methyl ester carboxylesterase